MANLRPSPIQVALDQESFEYLNDTFPDLLLAIEQEVTAGMSPDQVKRMVYQHSGPDRLALAYRAQQAARHIARMQG